jgi:hypothetical protein
MQSFLCQAKSYIEQIEFLHQKALKTHKLFEGINDPDSLMNVYSDRRRVAKILAKQIQQGLYQPSHATQRYIWVKEKRRLVYCYNLIDKVVISTIARELTKLLEPRLSYACYAFRERFNCHKVICNLSGYLRKHKRQQVFFYKTDVKSYFDTMPVDNQSLLWQQLNDLLRSSGIEQGDCLWQLIANFVRSPSLNTDGLLQTNLIGTATGSALSAMLSNMYLSDLDHEISAIPGAFYARFVDDIFICHTDRAILESAKQKVHEHMKLKRLTLKLEKDVHGVFSAKPYDGLAHYASINYLGYKITANGLYCFSTSQQRKLLHRVYLSIDNIIATNKTLSVEELGKRVCKHTSNFLINSETMYLNRNIYMASNDHEQLKCLDYFIALHIAKKISGINGAKAFRKIPYKTIRQQWGLKSLCQLRNHSKVYYEQLKSMESTQAEIA